MLNSETRRRIDACRDVLVGKLPSPQAQVEQITLALMYKFMNDMDRESMELGGKPQFFAKDFADYSWDRITDKRLSGVDRIKLYSEGIEAVNKNEAVPELFREIFKNAFLPYRDPETFNLFAKEISGFAYEHSEDLGDAYEYLLSIMSSQGDAGQFRTPRHIIDFMVEVVRPRVGERVLDPACGTGGFLISAYKHMRAAAGRMTPAKLEKLHKSIEGYDISPDMVRLSRVNMYLHQFPQPAVHEYDTLSDESRWADKADVILANPPFMTPKGGIRPHKKFGVKANRSEVLFVDYLMEHLTAEGRAAVIVPEGIIFQSAGAYASLRKLLLDGYLWAVASLPAGLFNPYSGVKTSILFMDRKIAALGGPILFAKVEADGFDLGAQRRANGVGDLPAALELLLSAHDKLAQGVVPADLHGRLFEKTSIDHLAVPREMILAESDHNLSMERYRPQEKRGKQKWPMVKLGEVFVQIGNGTNVEQIDKPGKYRVSRIQSISGWTFDIEKTKWTNDYVKEDTLLREGDILLSHINSYDHLAKTALFTGISEPVVHGINLLRLQSDKTKLLPGYAINILQDSHFINIARSFAQKAVNQASIKSTDIRNIKIPLPPLSVQKEIVAEIGRYQAVIDGARAVVDNWRPYFAIDPEWPVVKLDDVVCFATGKLNSNEAVVDGKYPFFTCAKEVYRINKHAYDCECLLLSGNNASGDYDVKYFMGKFNAYQRTYIITIKNTQDVLYPLLKIILQGKLLELKCKSLGGLTKYLTLPTLKNLIFPLPPLSIQKQIVARIEAERELVRSNEKLIELMKKRIEETIARVWE